MSYTFKLNLEITGNTLQEIDDSLVQAAGDRLKARMVNPPANFAPKIVNPAPSPTPPANLAGAATTTVDKVGNQVPPSSSPAVGAAPAETLAPAPAGHIPPERRGRKPGSKNKDKTTENDTNADTQAPQAGQEISEVQETNTNPFDGSGDQADAQSNGAPAERAPSPAPQAQAGSNQVSAASQKDAIEALKSVNAKFNVDKALELLVKHGAKKLSELTDETRTNFVNEARQMCGA